MISQNRKGLGTIESKREVRARNADVLKRLGRARAKVNRIEAEDPARAMAIRAGALQAVFTGEQIDRGPSQELVKLVNRLAGWVARYQPEMVGDVRQEMWVAIYEQAGKDSEFASKGAEYVAQFGKWRALNWLRRKGIVGQEDQGIEDEDTETGQVVVRAFGRGPEAEAISKVYMEQVMESLDDTAATVMQGLIEGYSKIEIARMGGISPATVTKATRRIAAAMAG